MPLITISGYPTSGKTCRAKQLLSYFDSRISASEPGSKQSKLRIHHITDSDVGVRREVYNLEHKDLHERSANASEKDARAAVYGAVKRVLSDNDIVILDAAAGNYIKGWRYQLHCEAKAVRTTSCVVHVGTPVDVARTVNEARLSAKDEHSNSSLTGRNEADEVANTGVDQQSNIETDLRKVGSNEKEEAYEVDCWENLVFRYEEPNGMSRWDSPLFTVLWDDEGPPCDAIWDAMIVNSDANGKKVAVRPNQATVMPKASHEGYLYELDRSTQDIINQVLQWQKDHPGEQGGVVKLTAEDDKINELTIGLPSCSLGLPVLQRFRRQFLAMNRQNGVDIGRIRESFTNYLNDCLEAL